MNKFEHKNYNIKKSRHFQILFDRASLSPPILLASVVLELLVKNLYEKQYFDEYSFICQIFVMPFFLQRVVVSIDHKKIRERVTFVENTLAY